MLEMSRWRYLDGDVLLEISQWRCLAEDVSMEMSCWRCLAEDVSMEMSHQMYLNGHIDVSHMRLSREWKTDC